jgi:ketosteroid isomerase-like protein
VDRSCAALVPRSRSRRDWLRRSMQAVATVFAVAAGLGGTWHGQRDGARAGSPKARSSDKADEEDVKAIKNLIAKYAKSVDDADTALAAKVWSDSPDVSFIHPRGHERGWKEVKENVYEKLMGKTFSERKLAVKDVEVKMYGDSAVATFYWDFVAKVRGDGSALKTQGRETQVYYKGERGWALVHVHYSGMPVKGKREGF